MPLHNIQYSHQSLTLGKGLFLVLETIFDDRRRHRPSYATHKQATICPPPHYHYVYNILSLST